MILSILHYTTECSLLGKYIVLLWHVSLLFIISSLEYVILLFYFYFFTEQQIDGETLLGLTERMVERLFPVMKHQVTFMKELNKLKK